MRRTNMTRPGPCPHWEKKVPNSILGGARHIQLICALERLQNPQCHHAILSQIQIWPCVSLHCVFFWVPNCCRFDKLAARNLAKTGRLRMTRQSSQPIEFANSSHTKHTRRSIVKSTCSKFCKSNMPAHVCKIGIPMIIMGVSFTINLSLMRPPPSFWPCQWAGSNKWKDLRWLRIPRS